MTGLQTNGWVFLNLYNPITAWAAYRGCINPTPREQGFISLRHASQIHSAKKRDLHLEYELERTRVELFSDRISRLTGFFVFTDLRSAELATQWQGAHFNADYLAELCLSNRTLLSPKMDANWISFAHSDDLPDDWQSRYWAGEAYPHSEPIWEVLTNDRAWILGTEQRQKAYDIIKKFMPSSLCMLELARLSAWIESDCGNISYFLIRNDIYLECMPLIDVRGIDDQQYLNRLNDLFEAGHPVNTVDLKPFIDTGITHCPDLKHIGFIRHLTDYTVSLN